MAMSKQYWPNCIHLVLMNIHIIDHKAILLPYTFHEFKDTVTASHRHSLDRYLYTSSMFLKLDMGISFKYMKEDIGCNSNVWIDIHH